MQAISRRLNILSKDGWKALTSLIRGGKGAAGAAEERLTKALGQRDDARAQRDKTRVQRDQLQQEVAELRLHLAEFEERRETQIDARHARADAIDINLSADNPARYAALLKRELNAESARVQALERNLDRVLRRITETESRLARALAMLAVAIDDGAVDVDAVKRELAADRNGSAAALSRALLATLRERPPAGAAGYAGSRRTDSDSAETFPTRVLRSALAAPLSPEPSIDETADVADDLRPAPGSTLEAPGMTPAPEEEPDVVDDARPAPGSSNLAAAELDERVAAAPVSGDVVARLPEPAVLKGKLLSPGRAKKVAEDRQLQIDGFLADGEYARIQALKDIHKGRRAFIVGNGPSLASQDLSKLDGEITFVANWFANHDGFDQMKPRYYAISSHEMFGGWARQNPVLNASFVEKLTRHSHKPEMFFSHRFRGALLNEPALEDYERRFLVFDRPKFLADEVGGLEFDLAQPMHDGYTVLLTFCVPLAVHMGITEIYMVGCDCDYGIQENTDARSYFYAPSEHATSSTKAENITRIWSENGPLFRVYELARDACAARGVTMFNATAGGKLEILPRVAYDEILSGRSMAAEA